MNVVWKAGGRYRAAVSVLIIAAGLVLAGCASEPTRPQRRATANVVAEPEVYDPDVPFAIYPDRVEQGDRDAVAESPTQLTSSYYRRDTTREITADLSGLPRLAAPNYPLMETLYNLALEEALQNEEDDGTFRTGDLWAGVWTRDIAYSVHLGLGPVFPQLSRNSLLRKVNDMPEIIQDTGTGGAWPVSTDRVVWALAAWDLYKVTGDADFLQDVYTILANTARRDLRVALDNAVGLFHGESSFMDWREQTYPEWMTPVDIYENYALSTLVGHAEMYDILGRIGSLVGAPQSEIDEWSSVRDTVEQNILDQLWLNERGYHSGFRYPRAVSGYSGITLLNEQTDSLGASLSVLTGVAGERAAEVVAGLPVVLYGVPSLYPQNPHASPYHNKGIWPFVTAYYTWAGKAVGNDAAVTHGMQALIRAAALFTTNKENMVYDNGHSVGTHKNSDRQLWSVAGFLTNVYRVIFGMEYTVDGLVLQPFVPQFLEGPFELSGMPYRNAMLDIRVTGKGNEIAGFQVNGEAVATDYRVPADAEGELTIEIELSDNDPGGEIAMGTTDAILPNAPELTGVEIDDAGAVRITWEEAEDANSYQVLRNGQVIVEIAAPADSFTDESFSSEYAAAYAVRAHGDSSRIGSLLSAYAYASAGDARLVYEAEDADGAADSSGDYVELEMDSPALRFNVETPAAGNYLLRFRYANGSGPVNTENKAALRSVYINDGDHHTLLMPQLGEWQRWEYSNGIYVELPEGRSTVEVSYEDLDRNMNQEVNRARIDHLEMLLLSQ